MPIQPSNIERIRLDNISYVNVGPDGAWRRVYVRDEPDRATWMYSGQTALDIQQAIELTGGLPPHVPVVPLVCEDDLDLEPDDGAEIDCSGPEWRSPWFPQE